MCGIAGIFNIDNRAVEEKNIRLMMTLMKHRGPDDEGMFINKNIGLGFVRLSILDLTIAGHQPMFSDDQRYVIVYNGEVYNYIELKRELKHKHRFRSNTDTEVVLAAYQEWGSECLQKFNGMFAFVIYDLVAEKIFVARDRFGIKPFYYYLNKEKFIFASEIKAILPLLPKIKENDQMIYDYLLYNRTDHTNETFYSEIYKLQHGSYLIIDDGSLKIFKWYNLKDNLNKKIIDPDQYRELFKDSLKLRLRSDVPIGVCLSGGLDSSSIVTSLINDFKLNNLNTFSAVYDKDEPSNESKYINEFNTIVKHQHFIRPNANSLFYDLCEFIDTHNEPVPDTGPYIQFKVMQLAKQYVKVTLDGQGADEQLAGYHYFFGSYYIELFKELKLFTYIYEIICYINKHHSFDAIKYFFYYLFPKHYQGLINQKINPSISDDFIISNKNKSNVNIFLYKPNNLLDSFLQHFEYKMEHLLRWEDLNSMHYSIEARLPFLDYRLVENTLSLPSNKIIKNGTTKYILREAMKDVLPSSIYLRNDKKGFSNPREKWFKTDKFKIFIYDLLNSSEFKNRGYFNSQIAIERYELHLKNRIDASKEIWKWINLEMWFKRFL